MNGIVLDWIVLLDVLVCYIWTPWDDGKWIHIYDGASFQPETVDVACFMCISDFQALMKVGNKQGSPQIIVNPKLHFLPFLYASSGKFKVF